MKKTLKKLIVAPAIYLLFAKNNITSKQILNYKVTKLNIEEMEFKIKESLNMAHNFLINKMSFKPQLVPSKILFKFLSYVFYKNNNKRVKTSN